MLLCRLIFIAAGGVWSRSTHCHWLAVFKAVTRTLLLAAHRTAPASSSRSGGRQRAKTGGGSGSSAPGLAQRSRESPSCVLAALPADVLVRVIELAAAPMSSWVCRVV